MVYRWRCRNCDFSTWSASNETTAEAAKSHLIKHYEGNIRTEDFGVAWSCPYCETEQRGHDKEQMIQAFKDHLFGHVEPLLESGVHVADDIGRTGNILVNAPLESTGADNARIHFLAPADVCLFVTTNPKRRIELLDEELSEWPAWSIIITTKSQPMAGIDGIDFSTVPLEVVQLNKSLGLSSLGETVARVLDENESTSGKISMEIDILPEIIAKFELQDVFNFLHLFTSRSERAGALSHYYFNPETQSESTVNILDQVFDMQINANGSVFESRS
jgi:rubredoxin